MSPSQPPGLKVILDTKAPSVALDPLADHEGNVGVAWRVTDEKLDLDSLKVEVRDTNSAQWREIRVNKEGRRTQ